MISFKKFILINVTLGMAFFQIVSAQENGSATTALARCSFRQIVTPVRGVLAADPEHVYVGVIDGNLYSFESGNLEAVWRAELGGEFASNLLLLENGLITMTNSVIGGDQQSSTIRLIGKETGIALWSVKLPFSERYYLGRLNGGIAAVSQNGAIIAVDAASGQVRWQTGPFGTITAKPAFDGGRVAFGTAEKQVIVLQAKNWDAPHKQPLDFAPTAVSLSKDGGFLTGDERGNVAVFGSQGNKAVWKFKSGAAVSSVRETEKGLVVTSLDNFVYLISDYNGDVIWKRRLPGRVIEGGLTIDGYFIAIVYGENSAYVLDLEKGKIVDFLPPRDTDVVEQVAVPVRARAFALTTTNSLETFAIGPCSSK